MRTILKCELRQHAVSSLNTNSSQILKGIVIAAVILCTNADREVRRYRKYNTESGDESTLNHVSTDDHNNVLDGHSDSQRLWLSRDNLQHDTQKTGNLKGTSRKLLRHGLSLTEKNMGPDVPDVTFTEKNPNVADVPDVTYDPITERQHEIFRQEDEIERSDSTSSTPMDEIYKELAQIDLIFSFNPTAAPTLKPTPAGTQISTNPPTLQPTPAPTPISTSPPTLQPTPVPTPISTNPPTLATSPPTTTSTSPPTTASSSPTTTASSSPPTTASSSPPTPSPTTESPTPEFQTSPPTVALESLQVFLETELTDGGQLDNTSSPQFEAMVSVNTVNPQLSPSDPQDQNEILTRYALSTLYFSTEGETWLNNTGWLSADNVCTSWVFVGCSNSLVANLTLKDNALDGSIPSELRTFSASLRALSLDTNSLIDNIPSQLGELTTLGAFSLQIVRALTLSLSSNLFSGIIPTEFAQLTNL
eukprot:scaffold185593_cov70-Attheya_sp.AAC.1